MMEQESEGEESVAFNICYDSVHDEADDGGESGVAFGVAAGDDDDDDDDDDDYRVDNDFHPLSSPLVAERYASSSSKRHDPVRNFGRHVRRVGHNVTMTTKKAVWDTNEAPITVALSAVDQWEEGYNAIRGLLGASVRSAIGLYGAAKENAGKLEHGFLIPVRDWVILPAFVGTEKVVTETVSFVQSEHAKELAQQSMEFIKGVPVIGENVLAPSVFLALGFMQRSWEIVQYPIPSKQRVRDSVDFALTGTKWALSTGFKKVRLYAKRADANITRTLSHTQWKILGSGPYATLDTQSRSGVIDHLCERYYRLKDPFARYELASHIRIHNHPLYHDLVLSGLLKERGGDLTSNDEWLSTNPVYRFLVERLFFIRSEHDEGSRTVNSDLDEASTVLGDDETFVSPTNSRRTAQVCALWFRLPAERNGEKPPKDTPWICFHDAEQRALEDRYVSILRAGQTPKQNDNKSQEILQGQQTETESSASIAKSNDNGTAADSDADALATDQAKEQSQSRSASRSKQRMEEQQLRDKTTPLSPFTGYATVAQWHDIDTECDVLVDEKRHSVSFYLCCPNCRKHLSKTIPLNLLSATQELCDECGREKEEMPYMAALLVPPPLAAVMKPNFWRFYGSGDEVRRSSWFLDTARHGLQPFDEQAQAILEDAYLFLKWMSLRQTLSDDDALLTVEVPCPDGTVRLVQFTSLTQATAIQKGLGAAFVMLHRRVYRGTWLISRKGSLFGNPGPEMSASTTAATSTTTPQASTPIELPRRVTIEDSVMEAMEENGTLGETLVPDASIRSILRPAQFEQGCPQQQKSNHNWMHLDPVFQKVASNCMAVPPSRLLHDHIAHQLYYEGGDEKRMYAKKPVEHLCLIVHGIGEMLRATPSIIECAGYMRKNHSEVQDVYSAQVDRDQQATTASNEKKAGQSKGTGLIRQASSSVLSGRVEYLPIEWHEPFSIMSHRSYEDRVISQGGKPKHRRVMVKDITVRTIPNMRQFANDTLMDILFFMSPEYHEMMTGVVANELNSVVEKFRRVTGFNGRISVVGHSLGSAISWDILAVQQRKIPRTGSSVELNATKPSPAALAVGTAASRDVEGSIAKSGVRHNPIPSESLDSSSECRLKFEVDNFFMLGSPVAAFLMLRNQRKPLFEDFHLAGCQRVLNVFHPYDPVAYRLEPCIDPRNADFEPVIIKNWTGGFRVQYQTKRLWRQLLRTTWETQHNVVSKFEAKLAGLGLLKSNASSNSDRSARGKVPPNGQGSPDNDEVSGDEEESISLTSSEDRSAASNVVAGRLNQGRRIDYMLQEKEIETANEYVAALAAHSCYWTHKDLSLLIAKQIHASSQERSRLG